jgi:hypothetical protein
MTPRISVIAAVTVIVAGVLSALIPTAVASASPVRANEPVVGIAATPDGSGYWLVASDGGVFSYGDAHFYGSAGAIRLNAPIVGMAVTRGGDGYWLVASDGGIFSYGDADFYGSTGSLRLNKPIVGMAATPDGDGYWLVASDGGIFTYGDADFHGSTGSTALNAPIVGMAATPHGEGYWLVASDGGVFAYGDADFYGSAGAMALNAPIVGMAATPHRDGYWLVASDGGVFAYGDAHFDGSAGINSLNRRTVGLSRTPDGSGYWLVSSDGGVSTFGNAAYDGAMPDVVALYGDSLSYQAAPYFHYLASAAGAESLLRAYGGWAICDDLATMASDAAMLHPNVAVIQFSGNAATPCMNGLSMGSAAYFQKYQTDAQAAIDIFRSHGIPVLLIGSPLVASADRSANVSFINQIYRSLASANPGTNFVDAGQAVLANGLFTWTLPCLPFEPCTGPSSLNVVRSPDGVHFCPDGKSTNEGWYNFCDEYASGAFRFAAAMVGPALDY